MRLNSFRIKNFRSIRDTGWQTLSPDNIACLIGQNESGKSSVLEALYGFYSDRISEDDQRSDGSYPEVSCSFSVSWEELREIGRVLDLDEKLTATLKPVYGGRINLVRKWTSLTSSSLDIEETALKELISSIQAQQDQTRNPPTNKSSEPEEEEVDETEEPSEETVPVTPERFAQATFQRIPRFYTFVDLSSLLPNTIDLDEIIEDDPETEGIEGAKNLFVIAGIKPEELTGFGKRLRENRIGNINNTITADFQEFWQQKIGKSNRIGIEFDLEHHDQSNPKTAGTEYFEFWVKDGGEKLYPKQRSKGVRWFLSFYIQLKASALQSGERGSILLIDEPGGSLHAKAQEDLLKVLEDVKDKVQVIYTTHSPHLVNLKTLYRLLAVQRADESDEESETKILGAHQLGAASVDTMSPVYTLMGADLAYQNTIQKENNVILEEVSAYYYLRAFWLLNGKEISLHLLPATGCTNVPLLCNLFLGWGLRFGVVLDSDSAGKRAYDFLKKELYGNDSTEANKHVCMLPNCNGIEDAFALDDFKARVLCDSSLTYTTSNSDYMKGKSKAVTALTFLRAVEAGTCKLDDLSAETKNKINEIIRAIEALEVR